jgi:hypothetical protein
MRKAWTLVAVGLVVGVGACDWSPVVVDRRTFSCTTDEACGRGWSCLDGVCVDRAAIDAGGAGGGGGSAALRRTLMNHPG